MRSRVPALYQGFYKTMRRKQRLIKSQGITSSLVLDDIVAAGVGVRTER